MKLPDLVGRLSGRLLDAGSEEAFVEGRRRAAVAIVLRERLGGVEFLLIKRAENPRDVWSGHMALPGGRWEEGDPDLASTARRETFEEVGIELGPESVLGRLEWLRPVSPHIPPIDIVPFVALAPEGARVVPNREVADHFWVSLEALRREGPSAIWAFELDGYRREWPAYPFGEHRIWGLTERILSRFFELLG